MVNHGFGGGTVKKKWMLTEAVTLEDIAKCISKVPGVLWAHVVHKDSPFKKWDIVWENTKKVDLTKIQACAGGANNITIDRITIDDESYKNGNPGKHPKEDE